MQAGTSASRRYDSGPITNLESVPLVQHRLVAARFTRGWEPRNDCPRACTD